MWQPIMQSPSLAQCARCTAPISIGEDIALVPMGHDAYQCLCLPCFRRRAAAPPQGQNTVLLCHVKGRATPHSYPT
jgi:hypothetical protein